ncbi:MAG: NAD/FAD-binding protein [Proteobacteria bacterium]|nr:NAD/FAD-binding protein [Pseudomonadota bacterium]
MRIAVIGGGVSGLGAAWLAEKKHHVKLYEKAPRIGGHAHTVDAHFGDHKIAVDTGFIVYNEANYPNLIGLFDALDVTTIPTDMSFSVSLRDQQFEYEGSLRGLLAQKSNLVKPRFWSMLSGLVKFYRTGMAEKDKGPAGETLAGFIKRCNLPDAFVEDHLLPMGAAIWSCPAERMLDYPVRSFLRQYVQKMVADLGDAIELNSHITSIRREAGGVVLTIKDQGEVWYDYAIMAAHADESLALIEDASKEERDILSSFSFSDNHVILHSDPSLMPRRRGAWAAWNYLENSDKTLAVTYWMNRLQSLEEKYPLFVTLNPETRPQADLIHREIDYQHPVFDSKAIQAQQNLPEIQGRNGLFWCGAWTAYGFHEDGLKSAVSVIKSLDIDIPWNSPTKAVAPVRPQGTEELQGKPA